MGIFREASTTIQKYYIMICFPNVLKSDKCRDHEGSSPLSDRSVKITSGFNQEMSGRIKGITNTESSLFRPSSVNLLIADSVVIAIPGEKRNKSSMTRHKSICSS